MTDGFRPHHRVRNAADDVRTRQLVVAIDGEKVATLLYGEAVTREVAPGPHRLRVHNTLVWKTIELDLAEGEQARFTAINRAGFGTVSMLGLLGVGPLYVRVVRQPQAAADRARLHDPMTAEQHRLDASHERSAHWKRWGPYLSERAWGTVREDYSADGDAWDYFPHDHARSRAYRWNEDGLAGICDRHQLICFALALWNGRDPILKERLFGLTGNEGNHGEDVKEYYFYLDTTPTHSYMKIPLQVSAGGVPLRAIWSTRTGGADADQPEYELLDTGVFDDDRYFDVVRRVRQGRRRRHPDADHGRQPRARRRPRIDVLPTLWFRNTWSWGRDGEPRRACGAGAGAPAARSSSSTTPSYGRADCCARRAAARSCSSPRTRPTRRGCSAAAATARRTSRTASTTTSSTATPTRSTRRRRGTKAAAHYRADDRPAARRRVIRLRLSDDADRTRGVGADFDAVVRGAHRARPTSSTPTSSRRRSSDDARAVMRQALAGLLWSKQFYHYVVQRLARRRSRRSRRRRPSACTGRNQRLAAPLQRRRHLDAGQVGVSVVRGLGPGVPLRPARAGRPRLRQGAARAAAARMVHAPERAAAGLRVGVRRRQSAGARLGGVARLQDREEAARRRRPRCSSSASSRSCCSTSPGGSTARTPTGATSSRAASSASTTSACSIAARRCRPAATSSSPTAPAGWRCTR